MLTDYFCAALRRATYEKLDDGTFYGSIAECPGTWANAPTLEACREELESVLDDWVFVKLRHGDDDFAVIDGIDLNGPLVEEDVEQAVEQEVA